MARAACSFCGKSHAEVRHLVAGPGGVAICDECVAVCVEVQAADWAYHGDVLLTGIGELTTNDRFVPGLTGIISDGAVAIERGEVRWAGPEETLPDRYRDLPGFDCEGRAAIPGFVDAHTHVVFGGERSDEFALRMSGATYEELGASGGGIAATVAATRATPSDRLFETAAARVGRMLAGGTTTLEIKSGYGLETATELEMLLVAERIGTELPVDVRTTFLGAHTVPPGTDRGSYVDLVIEEMMAACAPHADYCDVFCEEGAFTVEEARRVLRAGADHGLGLRLHANQLGPSGGARLAADLGAVSADHLDHVTRAEAEALAASGTVAVLLPSASYSLRSGQAPGRMLWETGVTVAIATDCNPGTSYVESMQLVVSLATVEMGLTPHQALWAATRGGALALELDDRGWIGRGAAGDVVVLDAPSAAHIPYRPGTNLAWRVFKGGVPVAGAAPGATRR